MKDHSFTWLWNGLLTGGILAFIPFEAQTAELPKMDEDVVRKASAAVVGLQIDGEAPSHTVTGFFVSADGLIVTSACALEGAKEVAVYLPDGKLVTGVKLLAVDDQTDLAVLATGLRTTSFLAAGESLSNVEDACAVLTYVGPAHVRAASGILLARRSALDWSETRFLECWSLGLRAGGFMTGAPVVTKTGALAGMCDFDTFRVNQQLVFAIPERAIDTVLHKARISKVLMPYPKMGAVSRRAESKGEMDPEYTQALLLRERGDREGAIEKLRNVLKRHQQDSLVIGQLSSFLGEIGQVEEANHLAEKAAELSPKRWMAQLSVANAKGDIGELQKAIELLQHITIQVPQLGIAWGQLARLLIKAGRSQEALQPMKKWTELEPECLMAWTQYQELLLQLGHAEEYQKVSRTANALEALLFKVRYAPWIGE